jgi:hypothetical protein
MILTSRCREDRQRVAQLMRRALQLAITSIQSGQIVEDSGRTVVIPSKHALPNRQSTFIQRAGGPIALLV